MLEQTFLNSFRLERIWWVLVIINATYGLTNVFLIFVVLATSLLFWCFSDLNGMFSRLKPCFNFTSSSNECYVFIICWTYSKVVVHSHHNWMHKRKCSWLYKITGSVRTCGLIILYGPAQARTQSKGSDSVVWCW